MNMTSILSILMGLCCGLGFAYAFLGLCGVWDNGDYEEVTRDLERMIDKWKAGDQ